ncbi:MAG: Nudix family hydrolase [Hahellaceae bacterium]|nr:Nudix family hydrolase [Hahellaceae bacterium]MCP5169866.1 Nudix family hydrolase [Hahellaceae bacterium]
MSAEYVHVAVAVIERNDHVLIARRPEHVHQGGLWEFPGGKLEPGETLHEGLCREIREELGLEVDAEGLIPLRKVRHDYGDKKVLLDVWRVTRFSGEPHGMEGQPVRWIARNELHNYAFPLANEPIVRALSLPSRLLITGSYGSLNEALRCSEGAISEFGVGMVHFRPQNLDFDAAQMHAEHLYALCKAHGVLFIVNAGCFSQTPEQCLSWADGVHLPAIMAASLSVRPVNEDAILSVACHNIAELAVAARLRADCVTLSPVLDTLSHPGAQTLGWQRFREMVDHAECPVYALGGLSEAHLSRARESGAVGIAAIGSWWRL